jgi:hypothetical protein
MSVEMNGMIIGALTGSATAQLVQYVSPTWKEHAEGVGFLAGVLASSLLLISPATRSGAYYGMGAAAFTNGVRYVLRQLMGEPMPERLTTTTTLPAQITPTQPSA